jgi:hypothetical protein
LPPLFWSRADRCRCVHIDRRSQYLSVGTEASLVSSAEFPISSSVEDEESHIGVIEEEDILEEERDEEPTATTPRPRNQRGESFVDGLNWDENVPDPDTVETPATFEAWRRVFPASRTRKPRSPVSSSRGSDVARSSVSGPATTGGADENTPLIRKSVSFSHLQRPERMDSTSTMTQSRFAGQISPPSKPLLRRGSTASVKSGTINYGGKSTFGQSVGLCTWYFVNNYLTFSFPIALQFYCNFARHRHAF